MFDWLIGINGEFEFFRELSDLCAGAFEIEREVRAGLGAEHDVLSHRHRFHEHEVLVDHADAERDRVVRRFDVDLLAIYQDLAAVGGVEAISDSHRRRLTGAILTHDGMDRSRLDDDVDVVVSQNIAEAFRDISEFEHRGFYEPQMNTDEHGLLFIVLSVFIRVIRGLTTNRISHFNFTRNDFLLGFFSLLDGLGSNEVVVVFVHRVANAVSVQTKNMHAR